MELLIETFLTKRKEKVKVNDTPSQWHDVLSGRPQGSVLGQPSCLSIISTHLLR